MKPCAGPLPVVLVERVGEKEKGEESEGECLCVCMHAFVRSACGRSWVRMCACCFAARQDLVVYHQR